MPQPAKSRRQRKESSELSWSKDTELLGLVFELQPKTDASLYPQYTIGLHAWLLDQVRSFDPELSAYLHDGQSEKPFTISGLEGALVPIGKEFQVQASQTYRWYVTALSAKVVQWLAQWVKALPAEVTLRNVPLTIQSCKIALPATTYKQLWEAERSSSTLKLSFVTPTSFRRKKHHFPLPLPFNVFHSYLRRWNDFSGMPFEQDAFLDWIDENVIVQQVKLESCKVQAGKKGSVTGFVGAIAYALSKEGQERSEFTQLFYTLGQLAPYCGTGHKTTFGLGQTRNGWVSSEDIPIAPSVEDLLGQRIAQLTEIFVSQRKRIGGERAREIAETWATILARRELGESLQVIAEDLEMPYQTVKTYVKLARAALKTDFVLTL
ncbi:MAG: CRISPR-associated endoribonuclease Cas6 [Phormidium sp.]